VRCEDIVSMDGGELMNPNQRYAGIGALLCWLALAGGAAASQENPVEATTAAGEKVFLLPNGRWEYADQKKAETQRKSVQAEEKRKASAQGGVLGIGRRIEEGDRDYNRGSLNPKLAR
jgi:hypothetical protein